VENSLGNRRSTKINWKSTPEPTPLYQAADSSQPLDGHEQIRRRIGGLRGRGRGIASLASQQLLQQLRLPFLAANQLSQQARVCILAANELVQLACMNIEHFRVPLLAVSEPAQQILIARLPSRELIQLVA
jgi:hypothetical protein